MPRRITGPTWDAWDIATTPASASAHYPDMLSMMMSIHQDLFPRRINGPRWDAWELATLKRLVSTDVLSERMQLLKSLQAQSSPPTSPTATATAGADPMQSLQQLKQKMAHLGGGRGQQFDSLLFLSQAYAMGDEEALAPLSLGPALMDDESL